MEKPNTWNPNAGNKFDHDKPPMALLDPNYLEGVARVLGFGANKYAAHNWRNGISYSRLVSAAYRHLGAINRGEDIDAESGLSHAYHLGCCTMFLASMMETRKDLDDRWKGPQLAPASATPDQPPLTLDEQWHKNMADKVECCKKHDASNPSHGILTKVYGQ